MAEKKKKILIVTDNFYPRIDGIARFLDETISRIKNEFEITILCPLFEGDFIEIPKVKVIRLPVSKYRAADYEIPKPILSIIKNTIQENEIIWTQSLGPLGYFGVKYAKKYEKALIGFTHSIDWELATNSLLRLKGMTNKITKLYVRHQYNKFDVLMAPSIEIGELIVKNGIRTPYKPVYLGVDTKKFVPTKNKIKSKEKIGIKKNAFVIGYHGRLGREKDLKTLYRGFLRFRHHAPNAILLIVGSGVKEYEDLFSNKPFVKFTGQKNDVLPYLQAMDIYVLPSLTETTSLGTLEAMACGLPVVVTSVGHLKEYIHDGKNGLIFPKQNPFLLSRRLTTLHDDENLMRTLSKNARNTVEEMYSWDKTVKDIKDILNAF
jgi:glycosyltransferase involved in cell wall biosynthesis